jgi:hypothetical protein
MGVFENIVEKMGFGRSAQRKPLYEPISLGPQCETKFQLCRVRYEREAEPDARPFSSLEMLSGAHENASQPTFLIPKPRRFLRSRPI